MANYIRLEGQLGRDIELRYSGNGTPFGATSLATNEVKKEKSGEQTKVSTWHNLVIIGDLAPSAANSAHKGDTVMVEGKIQHREYQDKEGNRKIAHEVIVNSLYKRVYPEKRSNTKENNYQRDNSPRDNSPRDNSPRDNSPRDNSSRASAPQKPAHSDSDFDDDDIPF